ncbi:MAG: protein translocase SEC61 complex subunit gamma [Candidatus Micrarchaeota archaeon]
MSVKELIGGFIGQSQRVISITHKPREIEYKQMAITTAIGIAIVGILGFFISMGAHFLRGS